MLRKTFALALLLGAVEAQAAQYIEFRFYASNAGFDYDPVTHQTSNNTYNIYNYRTKFEYASNPFGSYSVPGSSPMGATLATFSYDASSFSASYTEFYPWFNTGYSAGATFAPIDFSQTSFDITLDNLTGLTGGYTITDNADPRYNIERTRSVGALDSKFLLRITGTSDPVGFSSPTNGGGGLLMNGPASLPEPESWATLILGFGLIGGVMRGQRQMGSRLTAAC